MEGRGKGRETTLVLVGRTGNGKSATGNSILGRTAFKSRKSPAAITATCELQKVQMKDGRQLNVIDTPGYQQKVPCSLECWRFHLLRREEVLPEAQPRKKDREGQGEYLGLFDPNVQPTILGQEIVKCIDLAKDGVHGVLLVLSIKSRFTAEEATTLETLKMLFGDKIVNYMVVVFTASDELDENEQTFEDYLRDSPPALENLLGQCKGRKVLFDNKTRSETVKEKQRSELLKQIDIVIAQNGGHPYSNEMFREAQEWSNRRKEIDSGGCSKKEIQILLENMEKRHAEQLKKTTEMVEEKLRMSTKIIEQQLAAEKSARETKHKKEKPREPCVIIMKEEKPREPSVIIIKEEKPQESGGCVIM